MAESKEVSFLKLVTAVFVANVLSFFVAMGWMNYQASRAVEAINKQATLSIEKAATYTAAISREARLRAEQAARREQEKARQLAAANARSEAERQEAIKEEGRKEAAWKAFYKVPKACEQIHDGNMAYCGDRHIQARREFEAAYASRKWR